MKKVKNSPGKNINRDYNVDEHFKMLYDDFYSFFGTQKAFIFA